METAIVLLSLTLILSITANVILFWYASKVTKTTYAASLAADEIFARFDAYRIHLKSIFELQLFYGDKNLKEIIEHTKDMLNFMKKFDGIYSFAQTELEDMMLEEETDYDSENFRGNSKETQKSS